MRMRILVCGLLALHTVTLKWTQSNSPGLAHNTVYCGKKSGGPYDLLMYVSPKPVVQAIKANVASGTYYCVVTVTDVEGIESVKSNETKVVVP